YETDNDGEKIRCKFNELWNNIMSAISIAVNIELPMKTVKYPESRNIRHKLSFVDKTMRHTTKLGSLMRKIKYDKFIDNHKELTIPTHDFFSDTRIKNAKEVFKKRIKIDKNYLQAQRLRKIQDNNVKEHIIIDRAVISNENEGVRLALDPNTIRTHAKDTFAEILRKRNTKSIEQDVFW
ncbi:13133_t:CDS:2, partial [Rhizophagus irregularis]